MQFLRISYINVTLAYLFTDIQESDIIFKKHCLRCVVSIPAPPNSIF